MTMTTEKSWTTIYRLGALAAFVAVVALLFDIVLASMPGWGPQTAPRAAAGWLALFAENPLLGLRNLDLLNVTVSVVSVPLYLALSACIGATSRVSHSWASRSW